MSKQKELLEELNSVFSGRGSRLVDSFLPVLVFLITNPMFGLNVAIWGSLVVAGLFAGYRIVQKKSLVYSLGGLVGVLLAAVFVKISGSGVGFFLPGLISGSVTVVFCGVSVLFNRPMVAWTSFVARRWPINWYWHPKVLPAYNEVTIFWAVAFSARLVLNFWFFQKADTGALGLSSILLGWPFTIILLIITYLYGLWRLGQLNGPSIEEFKAGTPPPWDGQKRGF